MRKFKPTNVSLMLTIDNHYQVREQEILELRRAAEEERRVQNERITQLEHMVQAQMQHNLKLQSMLDSQFAQVRPSPIVETAAMTMTAGTHESTEIPNFEFVPPTRKAAPAAPPDQCSPTSNCKNADQLYFT